MRYVVCTPQIVTHPTDTSAATPFTALFSCSIHSVVLFKHMVTLVSPVIDRIILYPIKLILHYCYQ